MDLRCSYKLHGRLTESSGKPALEVLCRSSLCRRTDRVVVLHYFSTATGELLETKRYRNPRKG